ncbi:MAG: PilZ domain-containing protein [Candidatus Omnitrophica bacterium]|nr:PilZ domain-containing protein [Candidatus Omnitrophota bacterium]
MDREDIDYESSQGIEYREFTRFPVDLRLKFRDPNTNEEKEAQIKDISAKGIGILSDEELPNNTIFEMWIEIPHDGQVRYNEGQVVWSKQLEPNKYRAGVGLGKVDLIGVSLILRATYGANWL